MNSADEIFALPEIYKAVAETEAAKLILLKLMTDAVARPELPKLADYNSWVSDSYLCIHRLSDALRSAQAVNTALIEARAVLLK